MIEKRPKTKSLGPGAGSTFDVQSDLLATWHDILRSLPRLASVLGVPSQLHLVIDANIVIAEVRWMVSKRRAPSARTALHEAIASGTIVAYAPPVLRLEVMEHLGRIATSEGIMLEQLMDAWASYEPLLRFVEPPSLAAVAGKAAARDTEDAPYFELQVAVDAAAVYTEDRDLRGMGAPVVDRAAVAAARGYARSASVSFTLRVSGVAVLTLGIAAVHSLVVMLHRGTRATRRLPDWLQLLLAAAVLLLLLDPRSRRWLSERMRQLGILARRATTDLMPLVSTAIAKAAEADAAAQTAWSEVRSRLPERIALASQPLRVHVLAACTRAAVPLTVEEIVVAVHRQGYRTGVEPSRTYLRRVLNAHSALARTADGRWETRRA